MSKKTLSLILVLSLVIVLISASDSWSRQISKKFKGEIIKVDTDTRHVTFRITAKGGTTEELTAIINYQTVITINRSPSSIKDLKVGHIAEVRVLRDVDVESWLAKSIAIKD